ncbi:MAG: transcriptional repressor [Caldisericia bacterium]|nr:transcriptional repressor [Caldisericia bacterium]
MIDKVFSNFGFRTTKERKEILRFLIKNKGKHLSAMDIYESLKTKGVSLTSVYRTLSILESKGLVRKTSFHKRHMNYEISTKPHIHFICTNCGKIIEFNAPEVDKIFNLLGIKETDFEPLHYIIEIYGVCKNCKK